MKFQTQSIRMRAAAVAALLGLAAFPATPFEIVQSPLPAFASGDQGLSFATGTFVEREPFSFTPFGPFGMASSFSRSGYDMKFANKITLGVRSGTGYLSSPFASGMLGGPTGGFNLSSTSVRLGYDYGRLKPYVAVDTLTSRSAFASPGASWNSPLTTQNEQSAARVSAGFNYSVTNNLSFGVGVSAGAAQGFGSPFNSPLAQPGLR